MMRYRTRGKIERYDWYDISNTACEPFGFYFGDRVKVLRWSKEKNMNKEKEAWVIGVLNGMWLFLFCSIHEYTCTGNLYFHVDGDNGASKWSNMKKADFQSKGFRLIRRNEAVCSHKHSRSTNTHSHTDMQLCVVWLCWLSTVLQGVSSARSSPPPYNAPDLGQLLNESEPQQFYDVTFKLGGNGTSACLCVVCLACVWCVPLCAATSNGNSSHNNFHCENISIRAQQWQKPSLWRMSSKTPILPPQSFIFFFVRVCLYVWFMCVCVCVCVHGCAADGNVSDNEDADKDTGATPGGVLVHAHRCILSARSQYFRAMLKNGMKESSASVITIQDIDEEAFRCVLQFLYTGVCCNKNNKAHKNEQPQTRPRKITITLCVFLFPLPTLFSFSPSLFFALIFSSLSLFLSIFLSVFAGHVNITQDNYGKLLVSASRFQLDELLRFCYSQLTSVLTVKNVTELLSIATSHTHLSELKQRCMEYVLENYSTLLAEGSLTHLMKENNEIMVEILHQLQPTALKRKSSSSSSSSSITASPGATSAGTGETGAKFPRW